MRWLSVAVLLTILPLFHLFPYWIDFFCIAAVAYRFHGKWETRGWLLKFISIGAACGVFLQYGTLLSREAGGALLALLVCLKLFEQKGRKDAMLVVFLCYFLLMTWFFDSSSIFAAIGMLSMLVFLTANLFNVNAGVPVFPAALRSSAIMLLQALPFALLLFLLFPRIPGPIWALPRHAPRATSGLSDSMSPGNIGDLALSDAIAFRVKFRTKIPSQSDLYWRGPVLWDFDGWTWTRGARAQAGYSLSGMHGFSEYDVMLEPSGERWLFALDMPLSPPRNALISSDGEMLASSPVKSRMRYTMASSLEYEMGLDERSANLLEALRLPEGFDPKARALAEKWKGKPVSEILDEAIKFFRAGHFVYTLHPPVLGRNDIDDFLFGSRSGFCEHYASSFAFLMRAAGVPARIVTGYQGGEFNPFDHFLTVRQSDAHAWVEIWEKGRGWVRVDPTAIVAPARIESGMSAVLQQNDAMPIMMRGGFRNLRFGWDAAADLWESWVVGFGQARQKQLFSAIGMKNADLSDIATAFAIAITVFLLLISLFFLFRSVRRDRVLDAYLLFCRKMKRLGLERKSCEGPLDYSKRIKTLRPDLSSKVDDIVSSYIMLRYGQGGSDADFSHFRRMVKRF